MRYEDWLAHVHRVIEITGADWPAIIEDAIRKDEISNRVSWTRNWTGVVALHDGRKVSGYNLQGVIGEWCYAQVSGLERHRGFGDGGHDFAGIDAKASTRFEKPALVVPVPDEGKALRASYFACVVWNKKALCRYVGYATAGEVAAAPVKKLSFHPAHGINGDDLRRGLVPQGQYAAVRPTPESYYYAERGRRLRLGEPLGVFE